MTAPSGFTDTNLSNNSSTDTDTIFTPGPSGLTIGYWFNHQSAWYIPPGGVKGDVLLGDKASPIGGQPLFVPKDAATQLINSSQSANDTRQTLMSQAEATQLNLGNGAQDPGSLTPGHDLVSEAVYWLEGRSLADGSLGFIYSDTSSGNTDATHNGRVDTAAGGTYSTSDYNSTSRAFTFEGADGSQVPGKALTSNSSAWQQFVDTGITNPLTSSDFLVTGQGLKNALQAFNQGQLATSANGQQIAWLSGGTYSDFHTNDAAGMWTVLKDNGVAGIS